MCRWFSAQYVAPEDRDDVRHRPLCASSLAGLPKAHVLVAQCDPLYDEAEAYAVRLAEAGVPTTFACYPGMIHGFFNYSGMLEQSRKAVRDAAAALRDALGPAEVPPGGSGSAAHGHMVPLLHPRC